MGLIKNLLRYVIKPIPVADDTVIGTDSQNGGKTVNFRLADIIGGSATVQNNRFKEIDFGFSTEADLANTINALVDNSTDYKTVLEDEIPLFSGLVGVDIGSAVAKNYLVLGNGRGIYGQNGDITLTNSDLKELGSGTSSSGSAVLTEDITATIDVGGYEAGDLAAQNTSFTDAFKQLIAPLVLPTVEQAKSFSVSGISSQVVEIGEIFTGVLSYTFGRGLIDNKDGSADTFLVGAEISTVFSGNGIDAAGNISTPVLSGVNQWSADLSHAAGTDPYFDSDGNPATNLDSSRVADTLSDTSNTVTGRYKYWFDVGAVGSTPNLSAGVRGLADDGFAVASFFNITIPANNKEVAFYIPDTFNVQSVVFVESSNADVTSTFVSSNLQVQDGGGALVNYNKYTAIIGGSGYPSTATYRVTIN